MLAMEGRGLVEGGSVSAWEKRQPKRERVDENSTERSRAFRQKKHHETPEDNDATPSNATQHQETPRVEKRREEKKNNPQAPKGADVRFDAFWRAYPNRVGKDAARSAFDKRKVDDDLLALMLSAITAQAKSEKWTKDGGQFIPNPATWLNQGRWMDDTNAEQPQRVRGLVL
jgi:hypothetical protein